MDDLPKLKERERSLGKAFLKRLDEAFKACEVIELLSNNIKLILEARK